MRFPGRPNSRRAARLLLVGARAACWSRSIAGQVVLAWAVLAAALPAAAADRPRMDWDAWRATPVYHNGRIMPLDTFARTAVELITGRTHPTLRLTGQVADDALRSDAYAEARKLFPDDQPRKFTAAELLLSWLVEPEKWEDVPFLLASNETLREKYLEVPLKNDAGEVLKYVSPREVRDAAALQARLEELRDEDRQARAEGREFRTAGADRKVSELFQAYSLYRQLTFDPSLDGAARAKFQSELRTVAKHWAALADQLALFQQADDKLPIGAAVGEAQQAAAKLDELSGQPAFALEEGEAVAAAFADATRRVADQLVAQAQRLAAEPPAEWSAEQREKFQALFRNLSARSTELADSAERLYTALFDNEDPLRIVPALLPAALERERDTSDGSQPWLDLQTLLFGPPRALREYPSAEVEAVREAFRQLAQDYRGLPGTAASFAGSQTRWASALRRLGEQIEPLREKLPVRQRDEDLLRYTAYPPAGALRHELQYNTLEPFSRAWMISLAALLCYSGMFVFGRKTSLFWIGTALVLAGVVWSAYGFYLRIHVTGWAPVTNMYETLIYVPFFVSLLGLGFSLQTVLASGWNWAWRLSAVPGTWEARGNQGVAATTASRGRRSAATAATPSASPQMSLALLIPRTLISVWLLLALTWWPYAAGGRTIINLLPNVDVGSWIPDLNDTLTWFVGWCVLLPTVWYVPRALVAAGVSLFTVPRLLRSNDAARQQTNQASSRWPYAMAATVVAFLGYVVAAFCTLEKGFSPLQPVLRDNFWLFIHVLTIVSSYGAGALAWGLGMIALAVYLLGRYRPAPVAAHLALAVDEETFAAGALRPPQFTVVLAGFVYKAVQVAVLLLAAGTILGALWADVAWGRFWGWDPKEVWALISFLVYLAILHARYAGWVGNFGLAAGTVFGASAIIMSWYGVNFVLGQGLHSYGFGESDSANWWIAGGVGANWLLMGLAAGRYLLNTRGGVTISPTAADDAPLPAELSTTETSR